MIKHRASSDVIGTVIIIIIIIVVVIVLWDVVVVIVLWDAVIVVEKGLKCYSCCNTDVKTIHVLVWISKYFKDKNTMIYCDQLTINIYWLNSQLNLEVIELKIINLLGEKKLYLCIFFIQSSKGNTAGNLTCSLLMEGNLILRLQSI